MAWYKQIWAVYAREMLLLYKQVGKLGYIFSALLYPLIYLFAFGLGFGKVMVVPGGYIDFLTKGMLAITIMINAFQQTAISVSIGRFYFKTFQSLLLAPISYGNLILGICLVGVTRGLLAGGIIYLVASLFFPIKLLSVISLLGLVLSAICFALLGITIGLIIKNPDGLSMVINFIITPMTFFCGSFFPIGNLPIYLQYAVKILPLTLANELLRGGDSLSSVIFAVILLICMAIIMYGITYYRLKTYED